MEGNFSSTFRSFFEIYVDKCGHRTNEDGRRVSKYRARGGHKSQPGFYIKSVLSGPGDFSLEVKPADSLSQSFSYFHCSNEEMTYKSLPRVMM